MREGGGVCESPVVAPPAIFSRASGSEVAQGRSGRRESSTITAARLRRYGLHFQKDPFWGIVWCVGDINAQLVTDARFSHADDEREAVKNTAHLFLIMLTTVFRWLMVPLAAFVSLIVSVIVTWPLNLLIQHVLLEIGRGKGGKMFILLVLPYDGAVAAILFVLLGTWAAPANRRMVSILVYMIGVVLAWYCVGEFYSPVGTPNEPIRVWSPFVGTCCGGLVGCILAFLLFKPRNHGATVV